MPQTDRKSRFQAKLLRPRLPDGESSWAFVTLPREASEKLPRRGRTSVAGSINGHAFKTTLEPDGQLSHWLRLDKAFLQAAGVKVGEVVELEIAPVEEEPEPEVPADLAQALAAAPEARSIWDDTTTIARLDWIHWIESAKQPKTRAKRISDACDMLRAGKRRVCCFDQSGYYSKALHAPDAVE